MKTKLGTIHPNTMILRVHQGEAKDGRRKYALSTSVNGCPIVSSKQTGKAFSVSWSELIDLAIAQGIDKPTPKP